MCFSFDYHQRPEVGPMTAFYDLMEIKNRCRKRSHVAGIFIFQV